MLPQWGGPLLCQAHGLRKRAGGLRLPALSHQVPELLQLLMLTGHQLLQPGCLTLGLQSLHASSRGCWHPEAHWRGRRP